MFAAILALSLAVTPAVCLAPCSVKATVRIPPSPHNLRWRLVLDGPQWQASERAVEAPTVEVWYRGLGAGEYVLTLTLYRWRDVQRVVRIVQVV